MVLICGLLPEPLLFLSFLSLSQSGFLCVCRLFFKQQRRFSHLGKGECQGRNDLSGATVIFELFYAMEIFWAVSGQGKETETCRHRGVWECLDTKRQIPAGAVIEGTHLLSLVLLPKLMPHFCPEFRPSYFPSQKEQSSFLRPSFPIFTSLKQDGDEKSI